MKICWDNLEGINFSKKGNLAFKGSTYIEMDSCKVCCDPYLTLKTRPSKFCSYSCARSGENNSMYGKHHTIETIQRLSKISSDNNTGSLHPSWKGGVKALGLTTYDTHKDTLGLYEDIRKQNGTEILEVRCAYCDQWYSPTAYSVKSRFTAINTLNNGECRLYCSENCKQACPIYGRKMYPKGFRHTTSREVSPYLRQMVFERDNWTCQICGKTIKDGQLHCHHMDPVAQNPMFQNDMDSCITLCKGCHKMVHSRIGCRYIDLVCKKAV